MLIKEAIILAGGLGSRLRSAVPDLPKCLAPIAGKPFLAYLTDYLTRQGIEKFIFALGYKSELLEKFIQAHFSASRRKLRTAAEPGRRVSYQLSVEKEPLGTGGAIKQACSQTTEKTVLIVNGDTFFRIDLRRLSSVHMEWGADCTLSLKPMRNFDRYGTVELNPDHSVKSFREKKYYETGLINGGTYALGTKKFLEEEWLEKFSFEKDYLEPLDVNRHIFGLVQDTYFIDIGVPEDFQRAQVEMTGEFED